MSTFFEIRHTVQVNFYEFNFKKSAQFARAGRGKVFIFKNHRDLKNEYFL